MHYKVTKFLCIFTHRFWCFSTTKFQTQHSGKFVAFIRVSKNLGTLSFCPMFITSQFFRMGKYRLLKLILLILFFFRMVYSFGIYMRDYHKIYKPRTHKLENPKTKNNL